MPISYDERRKRREELRISLPPALQPHIALRNVEAVSYLSPKAQEVLLDALTKGRIRISIALDYLNASPILDDGHNTGESCAVMEGRPILDKSTADRLHPLDTRASQYQPANAQELPGLGIQLPANPISSYDFLPKVAFVPGEPSISNFYQSPISAQTRSNCAR
ncbi:MAG: hypothetical protein ABIG63_05035 [Chloroflexota bacterium]